MKNQEENNYYGIIYEQKRPIYIVRKPSINGTKLGTYDQLADQIMMMYKSHSFLTTTARTTTQHSMELYNNNDNAISLLQAVIEAFISIEERKCIS